MRPFLHPLVCLAACALLLGAADAGATDRFWDGGGGSANTWSNAANWSANSEPTGSDNAFIGHASYIKNAAVTVNEEDEHCRQLSLGHSAGTTGALSMTSGDLTVHYRLIVGSAGNGSFDQFAGSVTVSDIFYIASADPGVGSNSIGRYVLSNATLSINPTFGAIMGNQARTVARFRQHGGTISAGEWSIRNNAEADAEYRGWGTNNLKGDFWLNGRLVADGFGLESDLVLTNHAILQNSIANGPDESNGCYAVNRGRLVLKPASANANTVYWGDRSTTALDLVNAVKFIVTGRSGNISFTGSLYAPDHGSVPACPAGARVAGVWHFNAAGTFTMATNVTFRYDAFRAAELGVPETSLKVYRHDGSEWQPLAGSPAATNDRTLTVTNLSSFGWIAVADMSRRKGGTLVMIR